MSRARAELGMYRVLLIPGAPAHSPCPAAPWGQPWQVSVPRGDNTSQPGEVTWQLQTTPLQQNKYLKPHVFVRSSLEGGFAGMPQPSSSAGARAAPLSPAHPTPRLG